MKKFLLIITLFIGLAAQAQTYSPFLESGDTITIRQGENYLAATNDGLQRYTIANDNCLWKITIDKGTTTIGSSTYYYTLQNIATKQYIQITAGYRIGWNSGAYANISLGSSAATFYLNRKGGENGNYSQGGLLYRYVRSNNRTYDFYLTYNTGWTMQQGTTADLYLEKWTRKEVQDIDGYFTPRKHEFNLAKTAEDAQEQALSKVRYVFDLRDSAYLYCKNRPTAPKLQQTVDVVSNLNTLKEAPYSIVPTFKWESTGSANSQLNPTNFAATDNETTRNLLFVTSTGNISSDGLAYELSITPFGPSPKGLKNPLRGDNTNLIWVDYVDRLVATCTYKGKEYTSTMRVVRKSYHTEELPQFEFTLSPSTYTFTATGNLTQYFTINCTHQHGEVWYNIDEQKVDIVSSYGPAPVQLPTYSETPSGQSISWSDEEKTVTLSLTELNTDNPATWLSFTAINGNTITLTAQENNTNYRQARLVGEITYNKWFDQTVHSHTGSFSRIIAQRSTSGNYITFAHSKGYPYDGDKPTEVAIINGSHADEQQVHTAEKIIYHLSGEPVELRLPENNFFGYMRWYDYETGCNPRYNPTPHEQLTWALVPRANGTNFLEINTATGQSHGLYATADEGLSSNNRNNNTPIINAGTDDKEDTIACDVSAYTDYSITYENGQKDKIVEPTLSYRQLFILRPASEIAEKLEHANEHKFLEDYRYQAPVGRTVLLATQHRHSNYRYHISEMCYFYYDKNEQIKRVNAESGGTKLTWYVKDGDCSEQHDLDGFTVLPPNYPAEIDYQQVESDVTGTKTYRLMAMTEYNDDLAYNLHIAQFVVEYVDIHTHGPSTTELISDNEITQNYVSLTKVDFNKTKPTSSNTQYLETPLPWQDATYGFTYPGNKPTYNRHVNITFPFYGEYCFVNKINTQTQNWLKAETNRGGAANGFAMYVDGTMEPGIVATISTTATICSGQTLYCSAWFCNPATEANKTRPIFRCNVQGRKKNVDGTWQDWEDAGVYFVGEIQNTGWQQIKFPINSAQSYDETRVMIYNFATNNQGNDFMIDDINLFVSPLPIAAYQGKMACRSMSSGVATSAAVLRLDYSNLTEDEDKYIYYQIFNDSEDKAMVFEGKKGVTYFHENATDHDQNNTVNRYGSVSIPSGNFNPETDNTEKLYIRPSLSKFLDSMVVNDVVNDKCYVKTSNYGVTKWLLYVVHLIPNEAPHNDQAATIENEEYDTSEELKANKEYTMRMAHTPAELDKPSCNMQTSLTAVQQTMFQLRNPSGDVGESFYATSHNNCANELYMLDVEISNAYAERLGSGSGAVVTGLVYADWLKGFDFDAVYADKSDASDEALSNANSAFETKYGHKRGDVATAILYDMRRVPSASEPNPNYYAKSFEELQPEAFLSHKNYDIVKDLYEKGYLQFYQTTDTFYLASEDVARFWVYPISETAKATVQYTASNGTRDTTLVLHDCPEPRWVEVSSASSPINLNITQYTQEELKNEGLNHQLPRIKVVANQTTPVSISVNQNVSSIDGNAELFSTNDPQCTNKSQVTATVQKVDNTLQITPSRTYLLRPGFEYIMSVKVGDNIGCENTLYFTLVAVPEVVVWKPKSNAYNGWGMDANWKGWVDDGDGIVEDVELTEGYVPVAGVNVVIPTMENDLRYPSVTDHHHHPMDLNASSSTCNYIYFAPGAKIHNQHLLQYEKAFVDMQMTAGSWHLVSAPLQGMVSGDMFIPHNRWYSESQDNRIAEPNPFEIKAFEGADYQGIRHADAAYAFWEAFHEGDVDGSNTLVRDFSNMKFTQSNSLIQPLHIGKGYMVYGLGHQEAEQLTVRLPKPDTKYYYYNEGNKDESSYVDITQTNRGKLAYTVDHTNENMTIRLTKQPNSNYVIFGNPTMAYIDLLALYNDNKEQNGWNSAYTYVQNSSTIARTPMLNTTERYLPPMTSVQLATKEDATEVTINLKPSHLTLNTEVDRMNGETPSQLAARRAPISDNAVSELMTINAFTEKAFASMILATNPAANDYYTSGEDALFTSSGVENESYVTTPLNMYTVAEQVPMMADVRQGISEIPLGMLVADGYRSQYMQVAFYLSSNWSRDCYFCDTKTGQKIRIMDGLVITVEMPQNHEQRYFIEGPDEYLGSSEDPQGPTTAVDNTSSSALATLQAFSLAQGELTIGSNQLIQEIRLYDLAGRLILDNSLTLLHTTTTVTAPSGICLVEAVLRDGTTLHTQALVK